MVLLLTWPVLAPFKLSRYTTLASVADDHRHWSLVIDKLTTNEMPPPASSRQPAAQARKKVIDWVDALLKNEAWKNAGDPGLVLARRLSNAKYNTRFAT